ncbi:MAG: hypothetical protein HIU57_04630 [Acidobacteria bacterium]|nr:hypothetical protein [Acidobacteriota bacterium]
MFTHAAISAMVLGAMTFVGAGVASASTTTTTTPTAPPFQSGNRYLSVNVDTVMGSGSPGSVGAGCYLANNFVQGQTVVFRMWGIDNNTGRPLTGSPLTAANVQSVVIKDLPGVSPNPPMIYNTRDGYFTFGWKTSTATATGIVPFKVTVTLAPTKATYKIVTVKVGGKLTRVRVVARAAHGAVSYTYSEKAMSSTTGSLATPSQLAIGAAA